MARTQLGIIYQSDCNLPGTESCNEINKESPPSFVNHRKEMTMLRSRFITTLVASAAVAVLIVATLFFLRPSGVSAEASGDIGRYQISSWASYSGARVHHSGYFVLDTTTGEVVESHHEIHDIDSGGQ